MNIKAVKPICSVGFSLKNIGFDFAGTTESSLSSKAIFRNLNLEIGRGEFLAILGTSGCGKSTLLRILAQLYKPTEGTLHLSPEKSVSGFVFQDSTLLPWRNVRENVRLPFELQKNNDVEKLKMIDEVLAKVGLTEARNFYPHQLSAGMRMRVSIARALVTQSSVLFLDEPFAALDEVQRYALQIQMRSLWSELGLTVIFVTHSVPEAAFLSNRVIRLSSDRPSRILFDVKFSSEIQRDSAYRNDELYLKNVSELNRYQDLILQPGPL